MNRLVDCVGGRYGTNTMSKSSMVCERGEDPGAIGAVDSRAVERWDVTPLYVSWISYLSADVSRKHSWEKRGENSRESWDIGVKIEN